MSLIKKPTELPITSIVKGLIYGQPGIGKSTISLSAPNPIMFDFDAGMRRVKIEHQKDSVQITSYKDMLDVINSKDIDNYDTIIVDTLGKLIDSLGNYIVSMNPKYKQPNGSLTMQGWGQVKNDFQNLLKLLHSKNKSVIFVAHESEEKDGETTKKRPDCSGSARKDIVKELDFMGYMHIVGGKRCIDFSPQDSFYAKNSLGIASFIEVPNNFLNNNFLTENIFNKIAETQAIQLNTREKYEKLKNIIDQETKNIKSIDDLNTYYTDKFNKCENIASIHLYERQVLYDISIQFNATFDKNKMLFIKQNE